MRSTWTDEGEAHRVQSEDLLVNFHGFSSILSWFFHVFPKVGERERGLRLRISSRNTAEVLRLQLQDHHGIMVGHLISPPELHLGSGVGTDASVSREAMSFMARLLAPRLRQEEAEVERLSTEARDEALVHCVNLKRSLSYIAF